MAPAPLATVVVASHGRPLRLRWLLNALRLRVLRSDESRNRAALSWLSAQPLEKLLDPPG